MLGRRGGGGKRGKVRSRKGVGREGKLWRRGEGVERRLGEGRHERKEVGGVGRFTSTYK